MDSNLKGIFSKTISGGVDFIDRISKHLPKDFIDETNSLKQSFQILLEYLEDDKDRESKIYDRLDHLYERISSFTNKNMKGKQGIDEHETNESSEIMSDSQYLAFQENLMFCKDPSKAKDNPYTQVDVSVNSEVKGMYYCLVENGDLLLNKNLNREHAEYEIPLEKYAFRAEEGFKIKFVHNQLEIKLIFSCPNECDSWLEYFFKARQAIYSYASLPHAPSYHAESSRDNSMTTSITDTHLELVSQTSYPNFKRCWSVEDTLDQIGNRPDYEDIVDLSNFNLQNMRKDYENNIALQKNQNTSPKSKPAKNRPFEIFNRVVNPRNFSKVDESYENVKTKLKKNFFNFEK